MWKSEREFGLFVMDKLRKTGYECMRIESASTISGCPDLWVQGRGDDYFIELKNMQTKKLNDFISKPQQVKWRPGQQSWATMYARNHAVYMAPQNVVRLKASWTFIGVSDGIVAVRMSKFYEQNLVCTMDEKYGGVEVHLYKTLDFIPGNLLEHRTYTFSVAGNGIGHDRRVMLALKYATRWWLRDRPDDELDWPVFDDISDEVVDPCVSGDMPLTMAEQKRIMENAWSISKSFVQNQFMLEPDDES